MDFTVEMIDAGFRGYVMKSFKSSLFEEKKIYTRAEMIDWCIKNVDYFDITNATDNNNHLTRGESDGGFEIFEKTQTVYLEAPYDLSINTSDTFLPFSFISYSGLGIEAELLTDFSFKQQKKHKYAPDKSYSFSKCDALDFTKCVYEKAMNLSFTKMKKIHPHHLGKNTFYETLGFDTCNKSVYDLSNYDNFNILRLWFNKSRNKLKNLSFIIENDSVKIKNLRIEENGPLSNLVDIYLAKQNKTEHIMDFTMEMIDKGFEKYL
jgi:hypothetical protein